MNIGEFAALDREAQFAEAGRIAGVEPSTFDGIWRTESARGANMRSPAGAKGHFGLMDPTRQEFERRFGTTIDPDDFGQSLYTSAHAMKENMGRFKNLPDALRAYNGGWNPKTWTNAETSAYARKVLGGDFDESDAPAGTPGQTARQPAASLWDVPFAKATKPDNLKPLPVAKAAADAAMLSGILSGRQEGPTFTAYNGLTKAEADEQVRLQKEKDDLSFIEMSRAGAFHTLPVKFLMATGRDPEPIVQGFTPAEEDLKGYSLEDQQHLMTASSPKQLARLKFDIDYGKEQDRVTFLKGAGLGLAASFLAGTPEAIAFGGATSLAFRSLGVGSHALAQAGSKVGAIASTTAEGAIGNLVNTAALDMMGDRQGVNAYALGAAFGILNPMMQGRYLGRIADRVTEATAAKDIAEFAALKEAGLIEKATKNLGEDAADPIRLKQEMDRLEAEDIRADVASHRAAIPENRKMVAGEVDDVAEAADKTAPTSDKGVDGEVAKTTYGPLSGEISIGKQLADQYGETKVVPPFERPDYQAKRIEQATLPGGQLDVHIQHMTGGVPYSVLKEYQPGVTMTEGLAAHGLNPRLQLAVKAATDIAAEYLPPDTRIILTDKLGKGADPKTKGQIVSAGNVHVIALNMAELGGPGSRNQLNHTLMHELGHAIYHQAAPTVHPDIMRRVHEEWETFAKKVMAGDPTARADRMSVSHPNRFDENAIKVNAYALSKDEYKAEQFIMHLQNRMLAGEFGKLSKTTIDQVMDGIKAALNYIKDLIGSGLVKPGKASDEMFNAILKGNAVRKAANEEFLAPDLRLPDLDAIAANSDIPEALSKDVAAFLQDEVVLRHGLDRMPLGTPAQRAEAKQIRDLYAKAESPEFMVDEKRLSTLLSKVDALNPTSNMMLRSKNPVVRMAAIELLENGGGAAGRRSTASIAKHMNERAIIGDSIVKLDQHFKMWFKQQEGGSNMREAFTGQQRAEFNRIVAEEVEQRRTTGQHTDFGQSVRDAADVMEGSFERARMMQVDAKTAGWGALPESSRGYMPHRIKSKVYRELSLGQKRALHTELTDQFITISEYDPTFADELASKYLDRVEHRALGGFDAPMGIHQGGAADVVKEAMAQMGMSRPEIDAAMKKYVAGAAAHTKKRLNIDLSRTITLEDGSSFRLMDLYDTDMLSLLRGQAQRVSGEVALARHGVMGKPGLGVMRRAMGYGGDGEQALPKELGAFDQVGAEFLGQPFGEVNKWVDRAVQFNSVSSLGGMGFNQLGEQINVAATLGVKAALKIVPEFSRIRAEVKTLSKGGKVDNGLLSYIETMGGAEFGTDAYKMVFPLDNPDLFANSMGADSINAGDRILRGAGHLQAKLSLWRTIHSVQTRAVAEQIVLKAAKALKEGKGDFHLRDMGIDDDMLERLRVDFREIAHVHNGKVVSFDITKAKDKEAAYAFIQGVHRGASQIIQGNFIGETGKYVHNSWLRLLTQFRGFGLTAIDKQWNRQAGNRGVSGAVMLTLAAMSAAAPLYLIRTYAASIGRPDQQEYLDKHTSFGSIARATTNYIATAGLAGDFMDALTSVTGTGEFTGGRSGTATTFTGNLIAPAVGKVDKVWGAVQNTKSGTDPHALIKELPLARLPFLIPAINALDD